MLGIPRIAGIQPSNLVYIYPIELIAPRALCVLTAFRVLYTIRRFCIYHQEQPKKFLQLDGQIYLPWSNLVPELEQCLRY